MSQNRLDDVDRALADMQCRAGKEPVRSRAPRVTPWMVIRKILIGATAVLLPFLILVKVSVALHTDYDVNPWVAVAAGAMCTTILLVFYTLLISYRVRGKFRLSALTARGMLLLVFVFCGYSLLFISAGNVKSERVQETYSTLHPLLRLGVSTFVMADGDLVVTDAARIPEDYVRMGLPANESSLHFPQASGYVHAVDLRTVGRTPLRNRLMTTYFDLMGFRTIRHVGTADHLHVSLRVVE